MPNLRRKKQCENGYQVPLLSIPTSRVIASLDSISRIPLLMPHSALREVQLPVRNLPHKLTRYISQIATLQCVMKHNNYLNAHRGVITARITCTNPNQTH
jgi:hypothetical protein